MNQTLGTKWYVRQCAVGTGICLCVYVLLMALFSLLTVRGVIGEEQLERCVWVSAAAASLIGVAAIGKKTVKRGAMTLGCAGLAIYGGVIGALIGVSALCKLKKIKLPAMLDLVLLGFLIGDTLTPARVLWLILPILGGAALSYLLSGKKSAKKKRAKRKSRVHR